LRKKQEENDYILEKSPNTFIEIDDLQDTHFENKNELKILPYSNRLDNNPIKIYKNEDKYFLQKSFSGWKAQFETLEDLKTYLKNQ